MQNIFFLIEAAPCNGETTVCKKWYNNVLVTYSLYAPITEFWCHCQIFSWSWRQIIVIVFYGKCKLKLLRRWPSHFIHKLIPKIRIRCILFVVISSSLGNNTWAWVSRVFFSFLIFWRKKNSWNQKFHNVNSISRFLRENTWQQKLSSDFTEKLQTGSRIIII